MEPKELWLEGRGGLWHDLQVEVGDHAPCLRFHIRLKTPMASRSLLCICGVMARRMTTQRP